MYKESFFFFRDPTLRHTVGQIRQKCKETSYILDMILVTFALSFIYAYWTLVDAWVKKN